MLRPAPHGIHGVKRKAIATKKQAVNKYKAIVTTNAINDKQNIQSNFNNPVQDEAPVDDGAILKGGKRKNVKMSNSINEDKNTAINRVRKTNENKESLDNDEVAAESSHFNSQVKIMMDCIGTYFPEEVSDGKMASLTEITRKIYQLTDEALHVSDAEAWGNNFTVSDE